MKTDASGYPDEAELDKIRKWFMDDAMGLIQFINELWKYADNGYFKFTTGHLELHTAGWSGNEDIVEALMDNKMFWLLFWEKTERGGHYYFNDSRVAKDLKWIVT